MELKDQTIHFTHGSFRSHGEMTIVLFQFLLGEGRGMGKVKKLLKIIRTVECINPSVDIIMGQVQQFIEQFNEEFTETKKDLAANKRILDKLDKDKAFLQEVSGLLG